MNLSETYNWAPNDHVGSVYPHKLNSFHEMPHVWMIEPFDACFMTLMHLKDAKKIFVWIMEALFFFLMYFWSEGTQLMLYILLQFAWWPMNLSEA